MPAPLTVLMFPERKYPCDHAMLETVYTRELPRLGHKVLWVMKDATGSGNARATWNGTTVHLLPDDEMRFGWVAPIDSLRRIRRAVRAAHDIASRQRIDVVQVRNELAGACAALALRREYGIPFVYQQSFPLTAAHLAAADESPARRYGREALTALKRIAQGRVLRSADLILAISESMRAQLITMGLSPEKVASFPLGVDTALFPACGEGESVRDDLSLGDAPTVIYFGSLDRIRRLDFLLDVMVRVRHALPFAKLLLLGAATHAGDEAWLRGEAERRGLGGSVLFLGSVPRAQVPRYVVAANVSVAPIPPIATYLVASPTKVVESLGIAVPVVANQEILDQRNLVNASGGGACVPYEPNAFAEAVLTYLRDPAAARAAGARGREYVVRARSYERLAVEILDHYARVVTARRRRWRPEPGLR